jgi:hypothetical protein
MNAPDTRAVIPGSTSRPAASMRLINANSYDEWKAAAMAQDEHR